ncbi:ADP-ribosylation factor, putative [Babesia caballi]|uniref:ADP-ribosylation factor, putative n=1 Tax=Babesia caballi TaxID=5871 RepID=A0AAV4LTD9_BABCB|nr:ADP-ribosylation factor, putative [Babesia caballi]
MGFFNVVKRLPVSCLRLALSLGRLSLILAAGTVRGIGRWIQRTLEDVLLGMTTEPEKVLILGAKNAGKSSLLYRIKLGSFIQTVPTNSFIAEECSVCCLCYTPADSCVHYELKRVNALRLRLCEFGTGDDSEVVEDHLRCSSKVLFVVDASIGDLEGAALKDIASIVTQHNFFHQTSKYVIFNNKTDVVGSSTKCALADVKLPEHIRRRMIWVDGSALTGAGVVATLSFLLTENRWASEAANERNSEDLIQLN